MSGSETPWIAACQCPWFSGFCVLAIVNSAAMNIGVHVSFWIKVLSSYTRRSEIAGLCGNTFFSFLRNLHQFSSVHFSHSVVSGSLRPHGLQHARPPCPSPTLRVYSDSCLLSQWFHPTISSSVIPFSSHLQSFPASGCYQMSQFFASSGQSIGVSVSISVLPVNTQDWSPLGWTGWIFLQSKVLSGIYEVNFFCVWKKDKCISFC